MRAAIDFPDADRQRLRREFSAPGSTWIATEPGQVAEILCAAEAAARAGQWVVGFVAYEAAAAFDAALPTLAADPRLPLAAFAAYDAPDTATAPSDDFRCGAWTMDTGRADFDAGIASIHRDITAGRHYQVNYTTGLEAPFHGHPRAFFDALRRAQPDGFCAFLDGGDWQLASVSPELFFDWTPDGRLTTRPMKGTATRGHDDAEDQQRADELRRSEKEQAENLMIVDLLRNDLSRVAQLGSVSVPRLFNLEALPTAWQMTSTVVCDTRPEVNLAQVFTALFPCGSVTGAPKRSAMTAITELEATPRGAYCGAIGVIRPGGHATFNVAIRTVSIARGRARCGIGSGITIDASAEGEWAEWLVKRRFLLRASADFDLIETLRLEDGKYWLLERHLARLGASADHFGFPWREETVRASLAAAMKGREAGVWRMRLLLDRQGNCRVEGFALTPDTEPVIVALATLPGDSGDEFLRHKTTRRQAYEERTLPDVFDTLLWNEQGELTEFTRGNLVLELDGQRLTPALGCGLLPGTLRAELLASGEIAEAVLRKADLARASHIWFINSLRGWLAAKLI